MSTAVGTAEPPPPPHGRARGLIALIVVLDVLIGVGTGFAVYFSEREYGPPTAPLEVVARAATCVPEACDRISSSVTVRWSPPVAGGEVLRYVIFRDGEEFDRVDADTRRFVDDAVRPGERRRYEVQAIGAEGRGPRSNEVTAEVPLPAKDAARLSGEYEVELTFTRIDLLSRYEGVRNPSAGDTTTQDWVLIANCLATAGACDVRLGGGGSLQLRDGGVYAGEAPTQARCAGGSVRSTTSYELRITDVAMVDGIFAVTGFEGTSEVAFTCGDGTVHATSEVTGTLV
jgi:hypothetical protein